MQQTTAGIDVRVTTELPIFFVHSTDGPKIRGHVLNVWMGGEWHQLRWADEYRGGAPVPSHEGLAAIGTFIRNTVAQKPVVREWGSEQREQRECLQ